jgi:hypothetical protein
VRAAFSGHTDANCLAPLIGLVNYKVLESDIGLATLSWRVPVANLTGLTQKFRLEVVFKDVSGYKIDSDHVCRHLTPQSPAGYGRRATGRRCGGSWRPCRCWRAIKSPAGERGNLAVGLGGTAEQEIRVPYRQADSAPRADPTREHPALFLPIRCVTARVDRSLNLPGACTSTLLADTSPSRLSVPAPRLFCWRH